MRTVAGFLCVLLTGCTQIDRVNVHTIAINCDVMRGSTQQGGGQGNANVLSQSGAAAAQFLGELVSSIQCADGTAVDAATHGTSADTDG